MKCDLNLAINDAATSIAGGELYGRSVVVEHKDGGLELVTLYVVQGTEGSVLVDETGSTYSDLEDFRANNGLLTADDTMLTLRDITAVPGKGK